MSRDRIGQQMQAFEDARLDYTGAKQSRFRRQRNGLAPQGSGADYHIRLQTDFYRIMEYARDLDRNDTVIGQAVSRAVDNIIGEGITPDPQTGNEEADKLLWDRWTRWTEDAEECDIAGESTWHEIEKLVLRAMLVDGDSLLLPLASGQLQLLEAHLLRTPYQAKRAIVHGVELDDQRRQIRYWFTADSLDPNCATKNGTKFQPVEARDSDGQRQVFHALMRRRSTQTRGVSALAPIFDISGMHDDLQFAKLVQAQVTSCIAFLINKDVNAEPGKPVLGQQTQETSGDGTTRTRENMQPGMILRPGVGETVTGFSPQVPGDQFFPHVKIILSLLSVNLGMPLAMLLLDASESNFSGWRGAMDQARTGFRATQRNLVARLHRNVYRWKVGQWIDEEPTLAKLAADPRIDLFGHRWNRPSWPYIDPQADAAADLLQVRNGLNSPRRIQAARGRDIDEIQNEIVADNTAAIRKAKVAAKILNDEFDDESPVTWRDVLSMPTPDGMQVTAMAMTPPEPVAKPPAKGKPADGQ